MVEPTFIGLPTLNSYYYYVGNVHGDGDVARSLLVARDGISRQIFRQVSQSGNFPPNLSFPANSVFHVAG
jgi:hypothetical protein